MYVNDEPEKKSKKVLKVEEHRQSSISQELIR